MSKFALFMAVLLASGLFFACDAPEEHNGIAPQDILSIKNGAVAPSNEVAPWVVRIETKELNDQSMGPYWGHKCGGVLIGESWVLTAQHCTHYRGQNQSFAAITNMDHIRVFVGEYSVSLPDEVDIMEVAEIARHPGFVGAPFGDWYNDIALLRLVDAAPIGDPGVEKIAVFATPFQTNPSFPDGPIMGWGYMAGGGDPPAADELRWAIVPGKKRSKCNGIPDLSGFRTLEDYEICLGYPNTTTNPAACKGDSGGPWINWRLRKPPFKTPWTDENGGIIEIDYMDVAVRGLITWGTPYPPEKCSTSYFVAIDVAPFTGWIANYVPDVYFFY